MKSYGQDHTDNNQNYKGKRRKLPKSEVEKRRALKRAERRHGKKLATVDEARESVLSVLNGDVDITEAAYHMARADDISKAATAAARAFTKSVGSLDPADVREIESDIRGYLIKASDRTWKIK